MKNTVLFLSLLLFLSCKAQKNKIENFSNEKMVQDISHQDDINYFLSRIDIKKSINKKVFEGAMHLNIFTLSDPKSSSNKSIEEGTEVFYTSYLVSISPDGDYTKSKLYKIEGLVAPKILEIKEGNYPYFFIKVEYGNATERKTKSFKFEGVE